MKKRIYWVDTLKAIGMFFIVLGHFSPPHLSEWIYTFNVPLFFFVSGFLAKREISWKIFIRKIGKGLLLPYFIFCVILNITYIIQNVTDGRRICMLFTGWIFGFHSIDGMAGCLNMWFVYCLFIVRLLYQTFHKDKYAYSFIILCVIGLTIYHNSGLTWKSSFVNLFYAYPFFMLGYYSKQSGIMIHIEQGLKPVVVIPFLLLFFIINLQTFDNGIAYTYEGGG